MIFACLAYVILTIAVGIGVAFILAVITYFVMGFVLKAGDTLYDKFNNSWSRMWHRLRTRFKDFRKAKKNIKQLSLQLEDLEVKLKRVDNNIKATEAKMNSADVDEDSLKYLSSQYNSLIREKFAIENKMSNVQLDLNQLKCKSYAS